METLSSRRHRQRRRVQLNRNTQRKKRSSTLLRQNLSITTIDEEVTARKAVEQSMSSPLTPLQQGAPENSVEIGGKSASVDSGLAIAYMESAHQLSSTANDHTVHSGDCLNDDNTYGESVCSHATAPKRRWSSDFGSGKTPHVGGVGPDCDAGDIYEEKPQRLRATSIDSRCDFKQFISDTIRRLLIDDAVSDMVSNNFSLIALGSNHDIGANSSSVSVNSDDDSGSFDEGDEEDDDDTDDSGNGNRSKSLTSDDEQAFAANCSRNEPAATRSVGTVTRLIDS